MRRRTRWVIIAGALLATAVLAVAAGPRLACRWLAARCPWAVDPAITIAGAGLAGGPGAPPVVLVTTPAAMRAGLSAGGLHLPSWCVAAGQRAWGDLAGTPWLLRVEDDPAAPQLAASLSPAQAGAVVAAYLAAYPAWGVRIDRLDLRLDPEGGVARVRLTAAGAVRGDQFALLGVPPSAWLPVEALELDGTIGREHRRLIPDLTLRRATVAYAGMRMEAAGWLGPLLRRRLADPAAEIRLSRAIPWPLRVRVAVE